MLKEIEALRRDMEAMLKASPKTIWPANVSDARRQWGKVFPGVAWPTSGQDNEVAATSAIWERLQHSVLEVLHFTSAWRFSQTSGEDQTSLGFALSGAHLATPQGHFGGGEAVGVPGVVLSRVGGAQDVHTFQEDYLRFRIVTKTAVLKSKLERLLERPVGELSFDRVIDLRRGQSMRVLEHAALLFRQLAEGDSDPVDALWRTELENSLLSQVVLGIPHGQSHLLLRSAAMPAPRTVRRAEEYIRANAMSALTIEEIASAAGCSPRALQKAFVHFREITPMAHLRRYRLEIARERLAGGGVDSISRLCRELGFSNPGRFAQEFKIQFGQSPAALLA
jgi:AraC-like DNA-binding protein